MPRDPITADTFATILDRTVCSPIGATLLTLVLYRRSRSIHGPSLTLKDFLLSADRLKLRLLLAFVGLKTINRILSRLVVNNGWAADPPRWREGREVIVITGGAGGIGAAIVDVLARKTDNVCVLDIGKPSYKSRNVHYYKCDVSDEEAVHQAGEQIRKEVGHPTIIINNAGIGQAKKIIDLSADEFLMTLKVNCLAAFIVTKEFLPNIIKRNHGHIITTASSASYMSIPNLSEYAASKSGVLAFHEVLTAELRARYGALKVRTSVVCPAKVKTEMGAAMNDTPNQFFTPTMLPHQIGNIVGNIVDSGLSQHIVCPGFASLILPNVRSMPHWFRWIVTVAGQTDQTVTDETGNKARTSHRNFSMLDEYLKTGKIGARE